MTPEQERAYEIGIEALKSYETPQYGDLRLNAARASAKVVMALGGGGLIIVERDDLDVALPYAARDQDGAESPATARLRAVLSGTAPQPSGTLQDSQTSGDGTRGCLGLPNGSTGLSEPQPWKGNAVVLVDGQEIPVRANLTIQPSAWSVDAHLDPDAELYLPLGSCVVRLPDGREGSAYVTSVQNGVCGSLSGVGPPPTAKPLIDARAEEAEDALEAAQQALSRVVRYARALNESNPVTADRIAEVILGPGDYAEGAALAALTKENHRDA